MNGKGSKSRITNIKVYKDNFDQINWKRTKNFIGGRQITREEALKGLGDPTTWQEDAIKIYEEFRKRP